MAISPFLAAMTADRPIAIYGVDCQLSQITILALNAIGVKPVCISDGRRELTGGKYKGVVIVSLEQLTALYPDAHVLICPSLEFWAVHNRLWNAGMKNLHAVVELLENFDLDRPGLDKTPAGIRAALEMQQQHLAAREGRVFLSVLNVVLTEQCTLNCLHCSNLMPFIENKQTYEARQVVDDVKRLAGTVDMITSVHIMGGEPTLHRDLARVITELIAIPNLGRTAIVTNATHLPKEEVLDALAAAPKGYVFISHYGKFSRRADELKALLTARNIAFEEQPVGEWKDMGDLSRRGRTTAENREVFANCLAKNCALLLDGMLYRCSRSAFGTRLGMIPAFPDEGISLRGYAFKPTMVRERIKQLFTRGCLGACDYCDGTGVDMPAITGGQQAPANFPRIKKSRD